MRRVHKRVIELKKEGSSLSNDTLTLEYDLERIREVVTCSNLEQMRTLIENIYDWTEYRKTRSEEEIKVLQDQAVLESLINSQCGTQQ